MEIRISRLLYKRVVADLERPHLFALERVGFIHGKLANTAHNPLVLLNRYRPVPDHQYIAHEDYAACISGEAIRATMQDLRDRSGTRECAFHVHMHDHLGRPNLSLADRTGLLPLIPSFARSSKDGAHGIIILTQDSSRGWGWLPGCDRAVVASRIVIVGAPLDIYGDEE